MPFLDVKICAEPSKAITDKVISSLTEHTASLLGKKNELISIAVEYIAPQSWSIGGKPLAEQDSATFYLEIKITDGTNMKQEKSTYIQKVFAEFEAVLGKLNPASYIVLHSVTADSWGFEGQTQEYRYIKSTAL